MYKKSGRGYDTTFISIMTTPTRLIANARTPAGTQTYYQISERNFETLWPTTEVVITNHAVSGKLGLQSKNDATNAHQK